MLGRRCALVALVPIVLILAWLPQYQSPIRVDGIISASTLDDYIKLNRQQVASTPFSYFQSFLLPGSAASDPGAPVINTSDAWLYFLPRLGLLLALAGIVVGMAHRMDSCGGVEDNPSDLPRPEPAW